MLWLLALLPAVFATWQPFYVDTRANQVTSVGFSLQNYGSYTPGLPNVTVIWGGNVSAPICVGNPDCSGMQAVQITLGNDGKAPVVSDVWALSFPSPGAGSSWPVVATARHVGALDPHVGTPTTPGNPDVVRFQSHSRVHVVFLTRLFPVDGHVVRYSSRCVLGGLCDHGDCDDAV